MIYRGLMYIYYINGGERSPKGVSQGYSTARVQNKMAISRHGVRVNAVYFAKKK